MYSSQFNDVSGVLMNPVEKYNQRVDEANSLLCVGLDSDMRYIPRQFRDDPFPQFAFNRWVIEQTCEYTSAYKPNMAFYEARGDRGLSELKMTIDYLQERHPTVFTICDAKRGDIGPINAGYVEAIFDWMGFDSVTLHPYLGKQALQPFLERQDKCSIILCRTANPGAKELQDIDVNGVPFWQTVAEKVCMEWDENRNCMLVISATEPSDLKHARKISGNMTLLIPSVGVQGSAMKRAIKDGLNKKGKGIVISSSRTIIFAEDPRLAAKRLRDEINQCR
jgi:orotidine-5'-phosphate decarboxylase